MTTITRMRAIGRRWRWWANRPSWPSSSADVRGHTLVDSVKESVSQSGPLGRRDAHDRLKGSRITPGHKFVQNKRGNARYPTADVRGILRTTSRIPRLTII